MGNAPEKNARLLVYMPGRQKSRNVCILGASWPPGKLDPLSLFYGTGPLLEQAILARANP